MSHRLINLQKYGLLFVWTTSQFHTGQTITQNLDDIDKKAFKSGILEIKKKYWLRL